MVNIGKRNTPKLRFTEFSEVWRETKLGALSQIYDGTHQTPKYVSEGVPFYSVEHVTANQFMKTNFISEAVYQQEVRRVKIEHGDILMTRIGDIGTARLIDWDVKASFYVSLALIKVNNDVNSKYLAQYINAQYFQKELWRRTIHVAFPKKINLGEIGEVNIKYPSLSEQQKISSFLSSVDEWINNLKSQKEALGKYKKGIMQKIFSQEIRFKDESGNNHTGWEEKNLGTLCDITTGKLDANAMIENGKYRFYTCAKNYYRIDDYAFDSESLLISGNGANVGYIHYYNGKFNAYQRTYVLSNFRIDVLFLKFFLEKYLHTRIVNEKKAGNTPYIVMSTLSDMAIKVPVILSEQRKIAKFLLSIDDMIDAKEKQIKQTEIWKKGLMQGLFI